MFPRIKIASYGDLEVYRNSYELAIIVCKKIVPKLPCEERYDLADQLRRASKAIPRLIAEGYGKKHQKRGFQKYLDDALAENNEVLVCLNQSVDIYPEFVDVELCRSLINRYTIIGKQIYNLRLAWHRLKYP